MADELSDEQYARWWQETGEHELRQVLLWRWDPIGVADSFPNAADEYDGYAPAVAELLRHGATEAEIAEHLEAIERDAIGLQTNSAERLAHLAERLTGWFASSVDSWRHRGPVRR
jgi:hypothetical protein